MIKSDRNSLKQNKNYTVIELNDLKKCVNDNIFIMCRFLV